MCTCFYFVIMSTFLNSWVSLTKHNIFCQSLKCLAISVCSMLEVYISKMCFTYVCSCQFSSSYIGLYIVCTFTYQIIFTITWFVNYLLSADRMLHVLTTISPFEVRKIRIVAIWKSSKVAKKGRLWKQTSDRVQHLTKLLLFYQHLL